MKTIAKYIIEGTNTGLSEMESGFISSVVLRYSPHNEVTPWVTHMRREEVGMGVSHYWGHYFKEEHEARLDFLKRCADNMPGVVVDAISEVEEG